MINGDKCPLIASGAPGDVPEICQRQCESLYDNAVRNSAAIDVDVYPSLHCDNHGPDDHAHDALGRDDCSDRRRYVLVDECHSCDQEYGEQDFYFSCPFNDTEQMSN